MNRLASRAFRRRLSFALPLAIEDGVLAAREGARSIPAWRLAAFGRVRPRLNLDAA